MCRKNVLRFVLFLLLAGQIYGSSWPENYPVKLVSVKIDSVYDQMFMPQKSGWLGGDGVTSIVLDNKRTLWLFGDTFLGKIVDGKRVPNRFYVNSTIAIQNRTVNPLNGIQYYWRKHKKHDAAFFPYKKGTSGGYYWPTQGILIDDTLIVFCMTLNHNWSKDWVAGTVSIIIDNPDDNPLDWTMEYHDLGIGNDHFILHAALWYERPYLYFLAMDDPDDDPNLRQMILVRAKATEIINGNGSDVLEYWVEHNGQNVWDQTKNNAVTLFKPGNTETEIQYDEKWHLYYCTTYIPDKPEIYLTVAPDLKGPWSDPVVIYKNPDHVNMTYAAKCHPELSTKPGELIISYITAPIGVDIENQGMDVYRPRFLRVQLEKNFDTY